MKQRILDALAGRDIQPATLAEFRHSFAAIGLSLPAYAIIARAVEVERARLLGDAARDIPWPTFLLVMSAFGLAFPFVAIVSSALLGRGERLHSWVTLRHWAVLALTMLAALPFAMFLGGWLPYSIANMIVFALWFAILGVDIRLAQTVARLNLGAATLIASIITTLGLSIVLGAILIYSG